MNRTLEEILSYSRETGMDWALDAEEAGLLRREVERQAAGIARLEAHLAEECAKRKGVNHEYDILLAGYEAAIERAETAERELAETRLEFGMFRKGAADIHATNDALGAEVVRQREALRAIAIQLPGSGQVEDISKSLSDLLGKVADYRSREGALTSRADKAERELAEERAAHAGADAARVNLRDKLGVLQAHSNGVADEVERWCVVAADWKGRAEKAEVRAIAAERELERWRHGSTVEGDFVCPNELRAVNAETRVGEYLVAVSKAVYPGATKHPAFDSSWILTELTSTLESHRERIAELQALVDAATRFEWPPFTVWKTCDKWWLTDERDEPWSNQHRPQPSRDEAIALARDLAAKEKEPTR